MISTKRRLIQQEGTDLMVDIPGESSIITTYGMVGHATKQFASEVSLESHRQGQFYPEIGIENGSIVYDIQRQEQYLVISHYPEIIRREKCAVVTRMVVTNGFLNITGWEEVADSKGNIKKIPKPIATNMPVYIGTIKGEAERKDPGVFYNTNFEIMATYKDITNISQLEIYNDYGRNLLKIHGVDTATFPGLMVITASTETRGVDGSGSHQKLQ